MAIDTYLKDVLPRLPTQENNAIDELLPHNGSWLLSTKSDDLPICFIRHYRWPDNIQTPTAISVSPPNISARCPKTEPTTRPSMTPNVTMTVVAKPMSAAANQIFTSINANPTPTAIASILVPIAVRAVLKNDCLKGFSVSSSLGFRPSWIMCKPRAISRANAIQWSQAST